MTSLLVTNDFPPKIGGIQSYLWELWQRLDPASTAVLTARSHPDHAHFDRLQSERGLHISRVRSRILFLPTPLAWRRIRRECEATGATLVLLDPVWPLGLLGPFLGRPYGFVVHGAELAIPARLPFVRIGLGAVLRRASLIVSAGGYPRVEAERVAGRALDTVVEIPPGVDASSFEPAEPKERETARQRFGVGPEDLVVVCVSRLVPRKGMDVLVRAVAELSTRAYPNLTLLIAGSGRDDRRLRRLVEETGAPARLLGRVSEAEKAALLGCGDLFAMVCRNRWGGLEQEGFGIVFLEAAAAGLPQVAGESGGAAEAVVDGETGFVVGRPREVPEVVRALDRLLGDEALRRRLGTAARLRVHEAFDYDVLAPRLAGALAGVEG